MSVTRCELVLMTRLRPTELALLSAPPAGEGVDELAEFYTRFEKIKDFHKKNQNINAREFLNEIDELVHSDGLETIQVEDPESGLIETTVIDREFDCFTP